MQVGSEEYMLEVSRRAGELRGRVRQGFGWGTLELSHTISSDGPVCLRWDLVLRGERYRLG